MVIDSIFIMHLGYAWSHMLTDIGIIVLTILLFIIVSKFASDS